MHHKQTHLALGALLLTGLAAPLLGGCGGGVTPSVTPIPVAVPVAPVSGNLVSTDGGPLAGYSVVLNRGASTFTGTVTDAQGQFTLNVPVSAITGNDTLSLLDPAGGLVATVPVTLTPGSTAAVTLPALTLGPPPPPGNV